MGQAGSVEQRNAIRDVIALKPATEKHPFDKSLVITTLQSFCAAFPMEHTEVAPVDAGNAVLDIKERKLFDTTHGLVQYLTERTEKNSNEELIELTLTSFKRVILWRELYRLGAKCSMKPFLNCLLLSPKLSLSTLETLLSLIGICPGEEVNEKTEKWEMQNRRNFSDGGGFDVLRSLVDHYTTETAHSTSSSSGTSPIDTTCHELLLTRVLELFSLTLLTRKNMSDATTITQAVGALLNARISLLDLCHHSNHVIQEYAITLVKELFFRIDLEQVHELQEAAREYGALLYALSIAVGQDKSDEDNIERNGLQELCINLVEMFCAGNTRSKKAICRMFPLELFIPEENRNDLISRHTASSLLKTTRTTRSMPSFSFDFDFSNNSSDPKRGRGVSAGQPTSSTSAFEKWLQDARSQGEDWHNIIDEVLKTHERPELVWRKGMREELRSALRQEIENFEKLKRMAASGSIVRWDHEMFYVDYHSIQQELVVNGYFIEHLIPQIADMSNQFEVREPLALAWHLSDRLAVDEQEKWKILCVRCLRLILRRYAMVLHGQLPTQYALKMLVDHTQHTPAFIRECFLLLHTAIMTTRNAPSESLNRLSTLVATAVVDVLSDSTLISSLTWNNEVETTGVDVEEDEVMIRNHSDQLIRAGISVLQGIIRRAKYTLLLVRPKRMFICRLLAVETLDHLTVTKILTILTQLAQLDISTMVPISPGFISNSSKGTDNWTSLTLVYLLMACCDPKGSGMCLAAAEFLKNNYSDPISLPMKTASGRSLKDNKGSPMTTKFSHLLEEAVGFGGYGIGTLLSTCESSQFVTIFNAENTKAADVLWNHKLRTKVFRYLQAKYISSLHETHVEETIFVDDICVGNLFLRSYVEGDGQFLNIWTSDMYSTLIHALFTQLVQLSRAKSVFGVNETSEQTALNGNEPWEIQVLILKALVKLLPSHFTTVEISTEHYETLLLPLRRSLLGETDQIRGVLALELFIALLCATSSNNTGTCRAFMEHHGLAIVSDALEKMLNPAYQQLLQKESNMASVLLYRITDVLTTLSGQSQGVSAIIKNSKTITCLLELSSKHTISLFSEDAASVCLSALAHLCQYEEIRTLVIEAGGLLMLIDTCVFCPVEVNGATPHLTEKKSHSFGDASEKETIDTDTNVIRRRTSRILLAVHAAANALRVCLGEDLSSSSYLVLKQLLTPSFLRILRHSPERFVVRVQSKEEIRTPTLIWTNTMRERLKATLSTELVKVKSAVNIWPRWNPDHFVAADSFRYQYPELVDELIVHDVYLNRFVSANGVDLEDIDMSEFSQALLISIQSSENVLRILQQRGASDPSKEKSIFVMRLALNKLVSAHPQHNLEVTPTPTTTMAMQSLIESESDSDDDDGPTPLESPPSEEPIIELERMASCDIEDLTC